MTTHGTTSRIARHSWTSALLATLVASPAAPQSVGGSISPDALACAPRLAPASTVTGRVIGTPDEAGRDMFGLGDAVLLNVREAEGVTVGTRFFTRRVETAASNLIRASGLRPLVSTGWVRAVEVDEHSALALVEHACTAIRRDDQLAPFVRPEPVSVGPTGAIDYDDFATVLFGTDGRSMLGAGALVVVNRGADRNIAPGQRLAVFRPAPRNAITELGQAVAVLVEPTSATVQLIEVRQPVRSGDRVAVHR